MWFKPRILVVEDELAMLELLGSVLSRLGAEPRCVQSSRQAAELIGREKFDGMFIDWRMPEMDGLELVERIRWSKTNSTCPIVMLTGNSDPNAMGESFHKGVNFFLNKPVSVKQVERLLEASRGLMLEERLRYQRVPFEARVKCQWSIDFYHQIAQGHSLNVSSSGLLVHLDLAPPSNLLVRSTFQLPGMEEPLDLSAQVVRNAPGQVFGLRFIGVPNSTRRLLMNFVRNRLEEAEGGPEVTSSVGADAIPCGAASLAS